MYKHLNAIGLGGILAAFALTPAMISAQDPSATETPVDAVESMADLTAEQQAIMQTWPADQQSAFKLWPAETQAYFWTLSPERQTMFWALNDGDKLKLSTMPEPQRESVWAQIETQLKPQGS
jgi:hypothetical protein